MISNESPVAYKSLSLEEPLFLSLPHMFHLSLCTHNADTQGALVSTSHTWISAYRHQPTVAAWGSITQHLMDFSPHPATDLALKRVIKTTFNHENNRLFIGGKAEQLVLHINFIKLRCLMPKTRNVTVLIIICRSAIIERIFWSHNQRWGWDPNADRQMDKALKWFYLAVRQQHKRKQWNYTIKREPNQQTSARVTKPNQEPIKSNQNKHWCDI